MSTNWRFSHSEDPNGFWRDPESIADVADPQWERKGPMYDWREFIGERTGAIWSTFTDQQRLALAQDADERAGDERDRAYYGHFQ